MTPRSTSDPTPFDIGLRTPELGEQIRHSAYSFYEQRGRQEGHGLDDWLQAEAELTGRKAKSASA